MGATPDTVPWAIIKHIETASFPPPFSPPIRSGTRAAPRQNLALNTPNREAGHLASGSGTRPVADEGIRPDRAAWSRLT